MVLQQPPDWWNIASTTPGSDRKEVCKASETSNSVATTTPWEKHPGIWLVVFHPYPILEQLQRFLLGTIYSLLFAWHQHIFGTSPSTFRPIVLAPPDSYFIDSSHSGCSFIPKQSMFEVWCIMFILHRLCTSITPCRSICHTLTHLIQIMLNDRVASLLFQDYLVMSILFFFWWLNHIWVNHTYKPEFP